jgi:hypothetical protein
MKSTQFIKTFGFFALFIFFYGCTTEEITYITNNNAEGLGKVNVYIEGNMTNAEAQAKLATQIGTQTENIYVRNTTQLTEITINLGISENFRDVIVEENPTLGNLTLTGDSHKINDIKIIENTGLIHIFINGIIEVKNMTVYSTYNNPLTFICNDLVILHRNLSIATGNNTNSIITFNHLKYINYTFKTSYSNTTSGGLSTFGVLNMPLLEEVHDFGIFANTISLNSLKKANTLEIRTANLNLPLFHTCWYLLLYEHINNQTILALPSLNNCYHFEASNTNFTSNQVNQLLQQFLNILPASKQIYIYGNNAPPTGQGLIDKQTLINQGNTVITN